MYRRRTTVKYFLAAIVGAVIYCEWCVYIIQPRHWVRLECKKNDSSCTKVLFIADPQIQGDNAVPPPLSYLFNWDSDRYLRKTFNTAVKNFKPNVLVFLGDLMDEGSIATMQQFHKYIGRLCDTFHPGRRIEQIWIPGDNDIGGENEPIKKDKVKEFDVIFEQPSVVTHRNITYYKVNAITHTIPQIPMNEISEEHEYNLRIVVSHYPVTVRGMFAKQIQNEFNPNIYFCAHEHESKYMVQNKDFTNRQTNQFLTPMSVLTVKFDDSSLYEIYVPTCSYRMGTGDIGYGAAVIENNNKQMRYTVLWSSKRFPFLYFYLFILIVFIIYCLVFCVARLLHRNNPLTKSPDMSPLLERL